MSNRFRYLATTISPGLMNNTFTFKSFKSTIKAMCKIREYP